MKEDAQNLPLGRETFVRVLLLLRESAEPRNIQVRDQVLDFGRSSGAASKIRGSAGRPEGVLWFPPVRLILPFFLTHCAAGGISGAMMEASTASRLRRYCASRLSRFCRLAFSLALLRLRWTCILQSEARLRRIVAAAPMLERIGS